MGKQIDINQLVIIDKAVMQQIMSSSPDDFLQELCEGDLPVCGTISEAWDLVSGYFEIRDGEFHGIPMNVLSGIGERAIHCRLRLAEEENAVVYIIMRICDTPKFYIGSVCGKKKNVTKRLSNHVSVDNQGRSTNNELRKDLTELGGKNFSVTALTFNEPAIAVAVERLLIKVAGGEGHSRLYNTSQREAQLNRKSKKADRSAS